MWCLLPCEANPYSTLLKYCVRSYHDRNERDLAEVWISTPQRPGAGASFEIFELVRAYIREAIGIWPRMHSSGQRLIH